MLKTRLLIEPTEVQRLSHRDNILAGHYSRHDIIATKQWPLAYTHNHINSVRQLKETLRAGPTAWPGGYPLYFITADSEPLSFASVRECLREIMEAMTNDHGAPSWRIVGCEINQEDPNLYCSHSNERIESAYAEPEIQEETVES